MKEVKLFKIQMREIEIQIQRNRLSTFDLDLILDYFPFKS